MNLFTHLLLPLSLLYIAKCCKVVRKRGLSKLRRENKAEGKEESTSSAWLTPCDSLIGESQSSEDVKEGDFQDHLDREEVTSEHVEEITLVDNHLPVDKYGWIKNKFATVVNPFKDFKFLYGNGNSFKSVWLKCAACLAIADKINSTFYEFYDSKYDTSSNIFSSELEKTLNEVCQEGFKNYDLREYEGNLVIARASVYSTHVSSKMDGEWTKVLSDVCLNYVKNLNFNHLLSQHLTGYLKFDDFLCRSDGLYRDCNNLELEYLHVPQYKSTATFSLYIKPF